MDLATPELDFRGKVPNNLKWIMWYPQGRNSEDSFQDRDRHDVVRPRGTQHL